MTWYKNDKYNRGFFNGYMSGLEESVAKQLKESEIDSKYEKSYVHYVYPLTYKRYRPDFILPNGIVIETKGLFLTGDRKKHLFIKEQYPKLDLRFVFCNSNTKLSKRSNTTYGDWCEKHGFKYSNTRIPTAWLYEDTSQIKLDEIKRATNEDANINYEKLDVTTSSNNEENSTEDMGVHLHTISESENKQIVP